jgi:hypothetical protein
MSLCPQCGSANEPGTERCGNCGKALAAGDPTGGERSRTAPGVSLSSTLFGVSPLAETSAEPAPPEAPGRTPDTIPGAPPAPPAAAQTISGVGRERTLLGVAPVPAASGEQAGQPAAPATLTGGGHRTLTGVDGGAPLDQTIMGSFAAVPSSRGATNPGVGSSGKARTLPGPGDGAFAAVPAARAPLGMTHGPWLANAGAPPADATLQVELKTTAPPLEAAPELDAAAATADASASPAAAGGGAAVPLSSFGRTHLGVATPGIAPIRMSSVSNPAPAAPSPAVTAPLQQQYTAPLKPRATTIVQKLKVPRSALVLIATGALLLGAAGVVAVLWRGQPPLSALVSITEAGKERIDIVCEQCPDGTSIGLGETRAEVQGRKAYLEVAAPLRVGDNPLVLDVGYPGGRQTRVELNLPVEYRVRSDSAGFDAPEPYLSVVAEAVPGSRVVVAGRELSLDAGGRAEHRIELGARVTGAASAVMPLSESIPYAITSPAGHEYKGELKLNVGITPLDIESPGAETITGEANFLLAGRTAKGARVLVAGSSLTVDASGRFSQSMSIDAPGESLVTVRAAYDNLAPRLLTFRIRRVADLRKEERKLQDEALELSAAIQDPAAGRGRMVFVRGRVQDAKVSGERTILIVEPAKGCAERMCLARLISGGRHELKPGTRVAAFGRFGGELEALGKNRSVAEIQVALLEVE